MTLLHHLSKVLTVAILSARGHGSVRPFLVGFVPEVLYLAWNSSVLKVTAYQLQRSSKLLTRRDPRDRPITTNDVDLRRNYRNDAEQDDFPQFNRKKNDVTQFGILGTALKEQARKMRQPVLVSDVHELRKAVLDDEMSFSQVELTNQMDAAIQECLNDTFLENHAVLELMKQRFEAGSKPGQRQDNATLALAIEGGGMRGCVSAGMAAAIASLGLTDTIDKIYGSSAGSVVGSYMVSRQMCVDVYVDILPAAKKRFVCKRRIVSGLAKSLADVLRNTLRLNGTNRLKDGSLSLSQSPGMNISFVLDSIMGQDHGIRPLDMAKFQENNAHQELRIVASSVDEQGQLVTKCFGTEDFYGQNIARSSDDSRGGLFACLEASMTVPAATGPPVTLTWTSPEDGTSKTALPFFDAFCFEPIPYRSAVEEGATHVLALTSRPLGFQPKSKPGLYEKTLAPLYFHSHGLKKVADFFENGGQQYLYAEDILTLREAKQNPTNPVLVPPPRILYGLDQEHREQCKSETRRRSQIWKKAHLLPVQVPPETPELGTLEQDKDAVLEAVRGGYSAAFDLLAPIVGLGLKDMTGTDAAKLVFPDLPNEQTDSISPNLDKIVLETTVRVPGDSILNNDHYDTDDTISKELMGLSSSCLPSSGQMNMAPSHTLLSVLPGFQGGRLHHLSKGLRYGSTLHLKQVESDHDNAP